MYFPFRAEHYIVSYSLYHGQFSGQVSPDEFIYVYNKKSLGVNLIRCPVESLIGPWSDNYGFHPVDQGWLLPWCSCLYCDSGHVLPVLSLLYITWFTVTTADDYISAWIDCIAPSNNPKASQVGIRFISSCTMTQVGWCLQQYGFTIKFCRVAKGSGNRL